MDVKRFAAYILNHMSNAHFASGGTHINCRCPECGDSMNLRSAHMYIKLPVPEASSPCLYYCHKCQSKGLLTYKKFIDWNIYDQEIVTDLEMYHKSITGKGHNNFDIGKIYNVVQSYTKNHPKSIYKLNYINSRLGTNLSFEDLYKLKIVINLNDLILENNITKLSREPSIVNQLDQEFIGFLSIDNAFINMRRTCEEGKVFKSIDKRYINYTLFDKFDNSNKFYTVPSVINLCTPNRIKIHIAEGPFDILSVYLNCRQMEEGIYTSVTGNSYATTIMYFLRDLMIPNAELHFYPDNDKYGTDDRLRYMMTYVPDKSIPVYIHRNICEGEKDFGVSISKIKESISILQYR